MAAFSSIPRKILERCFDPSSGWILVLLASTAVQAMMEHRRGLNSETLVSYLPLRVGTGRAHDPDAYVPRTSDSSPMMRVE